MKDTKPLVQDYSNYTTEDFAVWATLYDRQMERLRPIACKEYFNAQHTVNFRRDAIPRVEDLNKILLAETGWKLRVVPNIQPNEIFFPCLAQREFTATTWLRSMAQLDYISEPDMFHARIVLPLP